MNRVAPLACLLLAGTLSAADLPKVERRIANEPAYKTKSQRYALLVIGPEARDRVWLVTDGDDLHVLADKAVKIAPLKQRLDDDSGVEYALDELPLNGKTHHNLRVGVGPLKRYLFAEFAKRPDLLAALKKEPNAVTLNLSLDVVAPHLKRNDRVTMLASVLDLNGPLVLAAKASEAPIIHFGGPLQITFYSGRPHLKRSRSVEAITVVGTPGLGTGTFAMICYDGTIPESARPRMEVTFPPAKPGVDPVKQFFELKNRCCGVNLYGPVKVEDKVGLGEANVTLSVNWEGVPVASTKHTLRVTESRGKELPVTSRLMRSLPHPDRTANVVTVRFTPSGKLFTAGYPSGIIQMFDPENGKELRRIESGPGYRGTADYALAPNDFSTLFVPVDGRKVTKMEDDQKKRYKINYSGELFLWDLATGKAKPSIRPDEGRGVVAAEVSPDGTRVITVERAGHIAQETPPADVVRMHDTATGKSWQFGEGYAQAAFHPDRNQILLGYHAVNGREEGVVKLFGRDGKELALIAQAKGRSYAWPTFSSDGRRFLVEVGKRLLSEPSTLEVYDTATRKKLVEFPSAGNYPFMKAVFSPDGRLIAAGDHGENLMVWDVEKREVVRKRTFKGMGLGFSLAFSPDGKTLAVPVRIKTNADRNREKDPLDFPQPRLFLFDLTQNTEPEECVLPHGWPGAVAFSPDGKTLAVGSAGAVHLLDVSKR